MSKELIMRHANSFKQNEKTVKNSAELVPLSKPRVMSVNWYWQY